MLGPSTQISHKGNLLEVIAATSLAIPSWPMFLKNKRWITTSTWGAAWLSKPFPRIVNSGVADEVWIVPCGPRQDKQLIPDDLWGEPAMGLLKVIVFDFPWQINMHNTPSLVICFYPSGVFMCFWSKKWGCCRVIQLIGSQHHSISKRMVFGLHLLQFVMKANQKKGFPTLVMFDFRKISKMIWIQRWPKPSRYFDRPGRLPQWTDIATWRAQPWQSQLFPESLTRSIKVEIIFDATRCCKVLQAQLQGESILRGTCSQQARISRCRFDVGLMNPTSWFAKFLCKRLQLTEGRAVTHLKVLKVHQQVLFERLEHTQCL